VALKYIDLTELCNIRIHGANILYSKKCKSDLRNLQGSKYTEEAESSQHYKAIPRLHSWKGLATAHGVRGRRRAHGIYHRERRT
jgi:hypothetical protein